jgi:hypothetical protein
MKKKLFLTITMVVWAYGMFAQTEETDVTLSVSQQEQEEGNAKPQQPEVDYAKLVQAFHQYAIAAQNEEPYQAEPIKHVRKDWISRHFHAHQRLEIAVTGGTDSSDEESSGLKQSYKNDDDEQEAVEGKGQFNSGLSSGYTFGLLFGNTDEKGMFIPSKFGFSLNTGFIASFDRQKRYGTTFDYLLKLGIEAGYNHPLGIELDFLLGTGKSCGDYNFSTKDENGTIEDFEIPYTKWCLKYGTQLSFRSNILRTQIKNTDIRLFVRYVYSKNPENEDELFDQGIDCLWQEESWSFGLMLCYTF